MNGYFTRTPSTFEEAEDMLTSLKNDIHGIQDQLSISPRRYDADWRRRAKRALQIKVDQSRYLKTWLRRNTEANRYEKLRQLLVNYHDEIGISEHTPSGRELVRVIFADRSAK